MSSDEQSNTTPPWPADGLTLGDARRRVVDAALMARLDKAETALSLREWGAELRHYFEAWRIDGEFFEKLARGPYRFDGCRGFPDAERSAIAVGELRAWRIDYHQNRARDRSGVDWFALRVYCGPAEPLPDQ